MFNEVIFIASLFLAVIFTLYARHIGLTGLVAWVSAQSILSNIFVLKQIELFGLHVTSSEVYIVSGMFSTVLIQEQYGRRSAKKALNAAFVVLIFLGLASQLHLAYIPSPNDITQSSYEMLFGPNLRIVVASIFAYWISQQYNIWIFGILSKKSLNLRLSFRAFIATSTAQILDTFLFAMFGLYGLVFHLDQIILFSLLLKVAISVFLSQTLWFRRRA